MSVNLLYVTIIKNKSRHFVIFPARWRPVSHSHLSQLSRETAIAMIEIYTHVVGHILDVSKLHCSGLHNTAWLMEANLNTPDDHVFEFTL